MSFFRYLVLLPALASVGCQLNLQKMPTPPSLQSVAALQVHRAGFLGLTGPMTAGPWKVTDISVGPSEHRCSGHLISFDSVSRQSYAFTVTPSKNPFHTACEIKTSARFDRFNDEPEEPRTYSQLECKFEGSSDSTLHLDETLPVGAAAHSVTTHSVTGSVTLGDRVWKIRSVHTNESLLVSTNPLGYEISSGASVIAAVETNLVSAHRIWIDPSLSEEDQQHVIGIAGALLLYEPPDGYEEEDCR